MKTPFKAFLITILLLCSLSAPIYGQDGDESVISYNVPVEKIRFQHLTTKDGLSEGRVWGILQDRRGFMWFTSWDGVNRYDGYEFRVFKQEYGNPNSPGGTGFWGIHEDREGMIWVASHTGGGLSRFDPTTEQWHRYRHDPDDPNSLNGNNVITMHEDRTGALWVSTETGGLNRLEGETEEGLARFTRYPAAPEDPAGLSSSIVANIYEDRSGDLWFAAIGGLYHYDLETETFTPYRHDPEDPHSLSSNAVSTIVEDRTGELWIGTGGGGLNRFDRETETFVHYRHDPDDPHSLSPGVITSILEDQSGVLWIGTEGGGLNRYDRITDSFDAFQHNSTDSRSLGNNSVTALFEDQTGLLWIGTAGGGIDRLDPYGQGFALTRHDPGDSNSLSNDDVRTVIEDQAGDLWIGTWNGLNRYDPETETFTTYQNDRNDPNSLSNNRVWAVLEDQDEVLWVGSNGGGLSRLDRAAQDGMATRFTHFRHDPADPQSLSHNAVTALYDDSSGILWVGTWAGGLNALKYQTDEGEARFKRYQHNPEDPLSLGAGAVWSIYEDNAGDLWVGTQGGGLCRLDRGAENFACYVHDPNSNSLSSNTVWAIHPGQDGTLWLGTSVGLNHFWPQTGQFVLYTMADGLPHDTVVGILEEDASSGDRQVGLWLSTLGGLSHFDPRSETFQNYDAGDGLQGRNFHQGAAFKTNEGKMLFGGQNGLTSFYPEDIQTNPNTPPVHVISVALANEPVLIGGDSPLQQSILGTEKLELKHDDQVLSFEFAALDYASPDENRYRYKLEGLDKEWIEVGSDRRFVTYANLEPGEYLFRVLGSNKDGVWNEEGASIGINITPPWWGTWWFRGVMLLMLVSLIAAGFVQQRENARRREKALEHKIEARSRELLFAQDQIENLFNNSRVGISLTTYSGDFVAANDTLRKMAAYPSLEEFLQRNATEFYADPGQREEMLDQISKTGSGQMYGMELRRKDGDALYAIMSGSEVQRQGDKYLLTIVEDITEQVRLNEQVRQEIVEREKAQRELQIQIALVDGLLDAALETVEIWDANTLEYVKWNETFRDLTGYSDDEIAAMSPLADFFDEAELAQAEAAYAELLQKGQTTAILDQIVKDGSRIPLEYTGAMTRDTEGNPMQVIVIGRDITERKQVEEQLRFQATLLDAVQEAILIVDINGQIIYWNSFCEHLYGWTSEEVMGKTTFELGLMPEQMQQINAEIVAALMTGKSWSGEYLARRRDGLLVPVRSIINPVLNAAGEPTHAISITIDITEGKRAEKALQASEKAYRDLVERIGDVVYTVDVNGRIDFVNPAIESVLGFAPEQFTGKLFVQFIDPEDLEEWQDDFQAVLSGQIPPPLRFRVRNASSETRWARVSSQPIVNEGWVIGAQGVLTDITERLMKDEKREQMAAATERQRLARELHDSVTQTLYSISLYGDAAHLALSAGNVDMIGEHLDALRSLVWEAMREMRILLFELRPPLLEKVGLARALQTRIESVETRTGSAVHFSTEGDGQLPAAVEAEVYRVALEALNNVVKHAQATNVDMHLTVDEARCTLIIQDNGIGFSPAVARHSGGHGLRNMQERIARVDGRLTLDTEAGSGAKITIEVDL